MGSPTCSSSAGGKVFRTPMLKDVLATHPELRHYRSVVLDLAYAEYQASTARQGESIDAETFARQFPFPGEVPLPADRSAGVAVSRSRPATAPGQAALAGGRQPLPPIRSGRRDWPRGVRPRVPGHRAGLGRPADCRQDHPHAGGEADLRKGTRLL